MKLLFLTINITMDNITMDNVTMDNVIVNKHISFLFLIGVLCIFVYVLSNTKKDK